MLQDLSYNDLYKAIVQLNQPHSTQKIVAERKQLQQSALLAIASLIKAPIKAPTARNFYLFGSDATPMPRPFVQSLADRRCVQQPNTILFGGEDWYSGYFSQTPRLFKRADGR